jgi:hypothetical protein
MECNPGPPIERWGVHYRGRSALSTNARNFHLIPAVPTLPPDTDPAEFLVTGLIVLASFAVVGVMVWLERRPRQSLDPRLVPTTPLLLVFGFIGLLDFVHLVNLYGIVTGRPN